jgi:hypothetical protein
MAVADSELEVQPQRRRVLIDKDNVRLRPGQYLIKTPEQYVLSKDRRGEQVRTRISYDGTAYGVQFNNNVAIIDDESVREIREVMLSELEGDETRLPLWFTSAVALCRKIKSDFGYEITPELPKLPRMTKAMIAASHGVNPLDETTIVQAPSDRPGQNTQQRERVTAVASRPLPGVDDDGVEEGREGMPAQPPQAKAKVDRRPESWKRRGRAHK